jgi:hypothetical protein
MLQQLFELRGVSRGDQFDRLMPFDIFVSDGEFHGAPFDGETE